MQTVIPCGSLLFLPQVMNPVMVVFNRAGFLLFVLSIGIAAVIGHLLNLSEEGPMMIIAGPIFIAADLFVRFTGDDNHLLKPRAGGSILFVPGWIVGVFWIGIGIARVTGVWAFDP